MSSSPWYIVSTTMRASGLAFRIWRIASRPLTPGSCRSIRVTSGFMRATLSTACSPCVAEPTTSMSGWRPMSSASPSSITR